MRAVKQDRLQDNYLICHNSQVQYLIL